MKVCITGVAGLLGSRLADYLINKNSNIEVYGIDNLSGGYIENVNSKVKFFERDIVTDNLEDIFNNNFDYVFHFAAYAAEGLSPFIRKFNYENNLDYMRFLSKNGIEFERLIVPEVPHSAVGIYAKVGEQIMRFHVKNFRDANSK